MKKILAKLSNGTSAIVFDDASTDALKDIYKKPNVQNAIEFNTRVILGEDQWYYVVPTEDQKEKMLGGYFSEDLRGVGLDTVNADNFASVRALYEVSGEEKLITKVTSRYLPKASRYVSLDGKPTLVEQTNSITITGQVDAYWSGSWLYFKKFALVQSLFPGIIDFYREATEAETNAFLSNELFELKGEVSSEIIGNRNRKRIADLIDSRGPELKDPAVCEKYLNYAKGYNLDLEIENGKIALIDNTDINTVLSMFYENYYTTPITGEKRETKSSKKLVHSQRKRAK